ncbi:unnamed protein product, partial [Meganyctiphanes norvegica]
MQHASKYLYTTDDIQGRGGGGGRTGVGVTSPVRQRHSSSRDALLVQAIMVVALVLLQALGAGGETRSPRVVTTKYGKLRGSIKPLPNKHLRPVEVFLGVPYATPPTGSNRFSPTRTPSPWAGERVADQYGPVCPQRFPDNWDDATTPPKKRREQLKRLGNYLTHQAEDCLYLNVYVPSPVADTTGHRALPVVVYIHGESFEWGAANPYDGSVMAAYGEVIVVTLNYRLGPLGFLNTNAAPGGGGRTHVMNHGLMDQIAALHWVQENIGAFGGDPGSVTLLGHGTGAACIHFLMVSSAVVPGLFHRAVLMSGSAMSSWATVGTPTHYALQLGRALNCTASLPAEGSQQQEYLPTADDFDNMVNCLKDKPLDELQAVNIQAPEFLYAFGPSIDGIVIRHDFKRELRKREDEVSKEYDLLFGVVPQESYDAFSENDIKNGFSMDRRDKMFRTLVRNSYDYHLNEVYISLVNEYTDWDNPGLQPYKTRNAALDALSDARFVAPVLQAANNLRIGDKNQFFYVFDHESTGDGSTQYPVDIKEVHGTLHGEELAYVFGTPLVGELGVFTGNWTKQDNLVAEAMLTYFTNFAKTGNPNFREGQELFSQERERKAFKKQIWENYDPVYQKYLEISGRPRLPDHYRAHQLALWSWLIPQLQRVGQLEFLTLRDPDNEEQEPEDRLQELSVLHHLFSQHDDPNLYSGAVRPLMHMAGHYIVPSTTTTMPPPTTTALFLGTTPHPPRPPPQAPPNETAHTAATKPADAVDYVAYSTALSVTIAIGVSLLILNILIFAGVYYQRDRSRMGNKQEQQQNSQNSSNSDQQMVAITPASGPSLGSTCNLEVTTKQTTLSDSTPLKVPPPSPLQHTQAFTHISECPPAFADLPTLMEGGGVHCVPVPPPTIPNGSATLLRQQLQQQQQLQQHQQHIQQQQHQVCPRPPPPPRLTPSESQPFLPAVVPAPPRGKIPPYEELRTGTLQHPPHHHHHHHHHHGHAQVVDYYGGPIYDERDMTTSFRGDDLMMNMGPDKSSIITEQQQPQQQQLKTCEHPQPNKQQMSNHRPRLHRQQSEDGALTLSYKKTCDLVLLHPLTKDNFNLYAYKVYLQTFLLENWHRLQKITI